MHKALPGDNVRVSYRPDKGRGLAEGLGKVAGRCAEDEES